MTKKERIKRMIKGQSIDRLPSDIWLSDRASQKVMRALNLEPNELTEFLDNHFIMIYQLDNHKAWEDPLSLELAIKYGFFQFKGDKNIIYDDWGVGWDISHEGIYSVFHPLEESENLSSLKVPDPGNHHLFERALKLKEKYQNEYCITGVQDLTIFEKACAIRGFNEFLVDLKMNQNYVVKLLDVLTEYEVELAKKWVQFGIDLAFTGADFGTQNGLIMSLDDWKFFIQPRLERVWKVYKDAGIPIMLHSCGMIMEIIPFLIQMGCDILNPIQHVMKPEELKERFGNKVIFFGGIDSQQLIPFGTPEAIEKEVMRYVNILGEGGKYIIAPDQCLLSDVPIPNILVLIEAVEKHSVIDLKSCERLR
jgi:uroporphyrinogen decarboxylase